MQEIENSAIESANELELCALQFGVLIKDCDLGKLQKLVRYMKRYVAELDLYVELRKAKEEKGDYS